MDDGLPGSVTGADVAVAFATAARREGLDVPVASTVTYARAVDAVGLTDVDHLYWAGRAVLVTRSDDVDAYNRAFASFWQRKPPRAAQPKVEAASVVLAADQDMTSRDDGATDEDRNAPPTVSLRYSPVEVLRHRDFAAYTRAEHAEARRLMQDLRFSASRRRSMRYRRSTRRRGRIDLRRTVQASLRAGGEPAALRMRRRDTQQRRLVLLLDVSGSMEPYARALARFLHAAVVSRRRVEAFVLGTRLTRVTRELSSHDPDRALAAAAGRVADWAGGTRLGEALRRFNDDWGVRGAARGAVVVVLSDGWDRGDPGVLAEEMARLARVTHRIVWVNPLKASEGYAPVARGMAAALPYVDEFVEGHSLAALEHLAEVIAA